MPLLSCPGRSLCSYASLGFTPDVDQVSCDTPATANTIDPHASSGMTSFNSNDESTSATGGMKRNKDVIFNAHPARANASSDVIAISELPITR